MGFFFLTRGKGRVTFLVISVLQPPPSSPRCKLHTVATWDCESSNPPAEAAALIEPSAFLDTNTLRLDGDGCYFPLVTLAPHSLPLPSRFGPKESPETRAASRHCRRNACLPLAARRCRPTLRNQRHVSGIYFFFFFVCEDKRRAGSCVSLAISALRPPKKKKK